MNENSDLLPNLAAQEDAFEVQLRGYSRRQVDEFVARCRSQVRELEERLGRSLDDGEQLRQEVKALRQQALGNRPAHEEVSERISQILKLADDEAKAQKTRADDDISKQLRDARQQADRSTKEARDQAEHMLTAAQEQAERAISTARSDAEKTRNAARAEADHTTAEARKKAGSVLFNAKSQAKQTLDEATARATAIHDGAERRLNLLSTRHAETIRRLSEILDGVSGLVAAETARLSLEDEVDQNVAKAIAQMAAEAAAADSPGPNGAPGGPARNTGPAAPVGDGTRNQRGGPGNPPAAPGGSRPASGSRGENPPAGPGRPAHVMPSAPGHSGAANPPGPPVPGNPDPLHSGRGAHEAPRGGAQAAPRAVRPPAPPGGAVAQAGDRPSDPARAAGPGPVPETEGPGGRRTAPEDLAGNRRPGDAGSHGATRPDGSLTGAIDSDEVMEGVRIVRERRQR
jgi:cell division septum initiation protein DivIVA